MLMNAKQFQDCVKEEPASTQMDLMSADVLLVLSRVKHLRNVKVRNLCDNLKWKSRIDLTKPKSASTPFLNPILTTI